MTQKQKTILVVDDDDDILTLLETILTKAGYKVITALNPDAGRALLEQKAPHAVLTDIHMEPENGFSFIESIRKKREYTHLPIIILSALNDFDSVKKGIALGITDYAIKPVQATMLLRKLRKSLSNKDFVSLTLPPGQEILMDVTVEAEVCAIGEAGYALKGPFKLTPATEVKLLSEEFTALGLDKIPQVASFHPNQYLRGGLFISDVTFQGLGKEEANSLRQLLSVRRSHE